MYKDLIPCYFIKRLNRFLGLVQIDDQEVQVHIPNTSRLEELLIKNRLGYLEKAKNPQRKTKYTLIALEKNGRLFNIDSQAPNRVLDQALRQGLIPELSNLDQVKREQTYGKSRFDFSFVNLDTMRPAFLEVKGVTLEEEGYAKFPGAPTSRGLKHLEELIQSIGDGYEAYVFFLLQFSGASGLKPHYLMDPDFAHGLEQAQAAGVQILAYDSSVTRAGLKINQAIRLVWGV